MRWFGAAWLLNVRTMIFRTITLDMWSTCAISRGILSFDVDLRKEVYILYLHGDREQHLDFIEVPLPITILQDTSLHPQLRILLVQPNHNWPQRSAFGLTETPVEAALQGKLCLSLILVHDSANLKQTVRGSDTLFAGRPATADDNFLVGLLDDLEVVGDQGADLVAAGEQVLALPEMAGGLGTLVLVGEVGALGDVSYGEKEDALAKELNGASRAPPDAASLPMPPQTPAQKASTSLPFFSNNAGWILSNGTRRTQRSCRVGFRSGLNFLKKGEEKMGSLASMGSKTSLRVAPKKTPTEATVPAAVTLRTRLMRPILGSGEGLERSEEWE